MTFIEWFIFFILIQIIHFFGTWKLYVKAERKAWEAAVPIYNAIVLMGIIKRPKWWVILLFVPIINLLMFPIVWIETCRSFGFNKGKDTVLAIVSLGFYIYYINYATNCTYRKDRSLKPPNKVDEWLSSIAFAIIAATLVHTYFMQPYTIPTSSLEKTLLVGDYLFVSKFHYGARVPMTTVAAPMAHDTIPILGTKSFLSEDNPEKKNSWKNKLALPYMRLPGLQKIKRNDIVVFSWPADTTKTMWGDYSGKQTYKPIDKRTNYVKRCVGIPGDSLEVRNGYVYINGKQTVLPDRAKPQWNFLVYAKTGLTTKRVKGFVNKEFQRKFIAKVTTQEEFNLIRRLPSLRGINQNGNNEFELITNEDGISRQVIQNNNLNIREITTKVRQITLTDEEANALRKETGIDSVVKTIEPKGFYNPSIFPHSPKYHWSTDNFGPIYIPKKGVTVALNSDSFPFYKEIIERYENNNLTTVGDTYYINGKKATSYTFQQDYYWMMGDNRQNSLDARNWGYVPFDHVVGKPVMIWLSWDPNTSNIVDKIKSIRWERMFTTVGGEGKPVSYLWVVIALLVGYLLYGFISKKKKTTK
ncbi:signal peptidase I [Tenacibaculum sp. SG-28]|uniref:signal peptidase I n=1 Tax=Tenacibaculum sp. SG-28 TaxID=754426 RepID=UPI000CF48D3A|nr:signal peptidase I [Tenacibaculum sp. SG-28]PQJ23048.1 signal peptidase I [Tenacibaculum sp. SG-28]